MREKDGNKLNKTSLVPLLNPQRTKNHFHSKEMMMDVI
jgi:hypothetical protein